MSAARVIESPTLTAEKCSCGTRIPPGGTVLRVEPGQSVSGTLFRGQVFCSSRCLRRFCLESMETLDALDTPSSALVVTDIHELHNVVSKLFVATLSPLG
jgi:hypothetical protein